MKNIRLLIAFDGTDFKGWQIQPNEPTIQGEIENNLSTINAAPITLHGAGRTDAGVHATGMVAHFISNKMISPLSYKKALNSMLPHSIRILDASEVSIKFHSRFSAKAKTYEYTVCNSDVLHPHERLYTLHIYTKLDIASMEQCCSLITGTFDFASFEAAGSRDPSLPNGKGSIRTITDANITHKNDSHLVFSFTGDGFLRHMVRNIMGTILETGQGKRTVEEFKEALMAKKRSAAGYTAPPHGLCLKKVHY